MFTKNAESTRPPLTVCAFRALHCFLFVYACAIIGGTFLLDDPDVSARYSEQLFGIAIAVPMLLGSASFLMAATLRVLFVVGIFLCAFVTFILTSLPSMTNIFFPTHLVVFGFAGVYGFSCIVLAQYFFAQPVAKRK